MKLLVKDTLQHSIKFTLSTFCKFFKQCTDKCVNKRHVQFTFEKIVI